MTEQLQNRGRSSRTSTALLVAFTGLLLAGCVIPGLVVTGVVVAGLVRGPAVNVNTFHPKEGATMDEVRAEYGPPSESRLDPHGRATWFYYTDRLGLGVYMVGVNFGTTGLVESSFNH